MGRPSGSGAMLPVQPVEISPREKKNKLTLAEWVDGPPETSVVVQGRLGGPVARYRVASRSVCRVCQVLGWIAVLMGACEMAIGVLVFHNWRRAGGWWAGIVGASLGVVATGITADTPVGTTLFTWMVGLGGVTFVTCTATLLALDGATWLDTKDLESCLESFDDVCRKSQCTCTEADELWDVCFDFRKCSYLTSTIPALLTSSVFLLVLALDSSLIFFLGLKCQYFGGGVLAGGDRSRPDPTKVPSRRYYLRSTRATDVGTGIVSTPSRSVFPNAGIGSKGCSAEYGAATPAPGEGQGVARAGSLGGDTPRNEGGVDLKGDERGSAVV